MAMTGSGDTLVAAERLLGKRLQNARRQVGMTQQDLCHQANLSYSTLAKIERGAIKAPSIFTIQSIAAALGISLADLVGEPIVSAAKDSKQRSKSGVRFVYFDINGCLVRFFHGAFARLAEDTGAPADLIENTFWHYNDAVCRGDISLDQFNVLLAEKIGVASVDWAHYYLEAVEPIQEMQALIAWASKHYHVGLLSNIMPGLIPIMRKRAILPNIPYDHIIDSSEVHAIKPEDAIYEIAAERAGCAPHEILLVDDARPNLMSAERLGWHVLWFDDYKPSNSIERIKQALELA